MPPQDGSVEQPHPAEVLLTEAINAERSGRPELADQAYLQAAELAAEGGVAPIEIDARRRLAIIRHHQGRSSEAEWLVTASLNLARGSGDSGREAECLNVLAGIHLDRGQLADARRLFDEAQLAAVSRDDLLAKIEQNLGIVANIEGKLELAESHYLRALARNRRIGDRHGVALALHNLGMVTADHRRWERAEEYFIASELGASESGDHRLQGLCRLNRAEVLIERQRYATALEEAESAWAIFSRLGSAVDEADALRVIGAVCRHVGQLRRAEEHLTAATELAARNGSTLTEAESWREIGRLRVDQGRRSEALVAFRRAVSLFGQAGAAVDRVDLEAAIEAIGTDAGPE